MRQRWRVIGCILAAVGLIVTVLGAIGLVQYRKYGPMYNTAKTDVDKILRQTDPAWESSALYNGVDAVAAGTEPGTYKMGLAKEYFYASSADGLAVNMDVTDGQLVIDEDGEFTVFVIGNRAVFSFDPDQSEAEKQQLFTEGYTTVPENLSDYGITLTLKDGIDTRLYAKVNDKTETITAGKPTKMGLKKDSFIVESDRYEKVNLVVIDGVILFDQEGKHTAYIIGDMQRAAYTGGEQTLPYTGVFTVAASDVQVGICEQADPFIRFCLQFRIQFMVLGIILLAVGSLYAAFPENAMVHYIIKRLGQSMLTILLIVCVVFLLLRLMPTDYFIPPDKIEKMTDQQKEDYLRPLGFLDNPFVQLGRFLYNAFTRFDLGQSLRYNTSKTVAECIADTFSVSMSLGMISLGIALFLGVVLGILQARFKDGAFDRIGTGFTIFVNAVPALVSYSLIWAVCTKVFGLPSQYNNKDIVRSCIGPVLCLSLSSIASYMLWMRRYMVDELNKDYIRLAKLKGLSTTNVMFKHVMRNAFLPLAQYLPYNILLTVGGSLLMETFFAVPGMGDMLTKAIGKYDVNLVQALVMFYAVLGILGLFLGDLLLTLLDPRISLTGKGETR